MTIGCYFPIVVCLFSVDAVVVLAISVLVSTIFAPNHLVSFVLPALIVLGKGKMPVAVYVITWEMPSAPAGVALQTVGFGIALGTVALMALAWCGVPVG